MGLADLLPVSYALDGEVVHDSVAFEDGKPGKLPQFPFIEIHPVIDWQDGGCSLEILNSCSKQAWKRVSNWTNIKILIGSCTNHLLLRESEV